MGPGDVGSIPVRPAGVCSTAGAALPPVLPQIQRFRALKCCSNCTVWAGLVQGEYATQTELGVLCFPDDLDAHSCAPSAASSEEGTWQSRNISYPFFILAKRLAEAASREECGPLVLNQSIHAPLHTCSPPLSSFYTASPSAGGEHRTSNSEDSIWLWDLTALCSSVWHRSLSPRYHPSAEPRSWGWLPICSSPGINYPHTKHRQKYSSTRAFAMDENWLRALFLAHTKSTPRQAKAFFLGKLSLLRGGILHLSQVGVRFLVYVT